MLQRVLFSKKQLDFLLDILFIRVMRLKTQDILNVLHLNYKYLLKLKSDSMLSFLNFLTRSTAYSTVTSFSVNICTCIIVFAHIIQGAAVGFDEF